MNLLPIKQHLNQNPEFVKHPDCEDSLPMTIEFYKRVGFEPPWIGYYVQKDGAIVGCAAFKGRPVDGKVEIAYGTVLAYQQQGVGTAIAKELVQLSLRTDPSVIITARTLPENNFSTRILKKNGFRLLGLVVDPEDGEVWEWQYQAND